MTQLPLRGPALRLCQTLDLVVDLVDGFQAPASSQSPEIVSSHVETVDRWLGIDAAAVPVGLSLVELEGSLVHRELQQLEDAFFEGQSVDRTDGLESVAEFGIHVVDVQDR